MTPGPVTATKAGPSDLFSLRTLHLWTLSAFAIMQPLLTALALRPVYLHDQKFGWVEITTLLFVLSIVIPFGLFLADRLLWQLSQRFHGWGHNTIFVALFALLLLSVLRPMVIIDWLSAQASSGLFALSIAIPGSLLIATLYDRFRWLRSWLTIGSVGILVFPCSFLIQLQVICRGEALIPADLTVNNPVPVVLIVFDEFSGTTLLDENLNVDSLRFPQFARLAKLSTWYRNATTVHPRTEIAVPTILTGRSPVIDRPPLAVNYPGNLLQLIDATRAYEMTVFEPMTRLCPPSVHQDAPRESPTLFKCIDLFHTLAAVYPRLIFTNDTPVYFPTIPKPWFGIREELSKGWEHYIGMNTGLFHYPGSESRARQFRHFLKCLEPGSRPRFCFMHAVIPHFPWSFLPSGDQYQSENASPPRPSGTHDEFGEHWENEPATVVRNEYRYRLQVGYVDRFVGELIDELELTKMFDQCLLIITADHGVAFRPGHSRRIPDAETLPEIVSVPLFIKLPGQSESRIDDRNVESIDILPTIAEVLDLEPPIPADGISVSKEKRSSRKTVYFEGKMTIVEPDLPQRVSSVRRQAAIFGTGPIDQLPKSSASRPEWHGRPLSSFKIDKSTIPVELFNPDNRKNDWQFNMNTNLSPRLISGRFDDGDLPGIPAEVVLVIDGIVRDTSKTTRLNRNDQQFQFLVPQTSVEGQPEHVELYIVDATRSPSTLRKLDNTSEVPLSIR